MSRTATILFKPEGVICKGSRNAYGNILVSSLDQPNNHLGAVRGVSVFNATCQRLSFHLLAEIREEQSAVVRIMCALVDRVWRLCRHAALMFEGWICVIMYLPVVGRFYDRRSGCRANARARRLNELAISPPHALFYYSFGP
jgi:hypothetical protein